MLKQFKKHIKDFFAPHAYGVTVVNCTYHRPMALKADGYSKSFLKDDQYFEICEKIREAE